MLSEKQKNRQECCGDLSKPGPTSECNKRNYFGRIYLRRISLFPSLVVCSAGRYVCQGIRHAVNAKSGEKKKLKYFLKSGENPPLSRAGVNIPPAMRRKILLTENSWKKEKFGHYMFCQALKLTQFDIFPAIFCSKHLFSYSQPFRINANIHPLSGE